MVVSNTNQRIGILNTVPSLLERALRLDKLV
nr:MAG TPA: hypothetical protein [Caudoviricetes sp.]